MPTNPFVSNLMNRYFGGTKVSPETAPYLTGYHWLFIQAPQSIAGVDADGTKMLTALCQSVTLPSVTLNKTTIPALGGFKFHFPTSVDVGDVLTARFSEHTGLPVYRLLDNWVKAIRDFNWGVSKAQSGVVPGFYKSTIYYFTSQPTKPTSETVEFYAKFTGCFPTRIPTDSFGSDISTVDKIDLDIEFSLDMMYTEPFVKTELAPFLSMITVPGSANPGETG